MTECSAMTFFKQLLNQGLKDQQLGLSSEPDEKNFQHDLCIISFQWLLLLALYQRGMENQQA